MFNIFKKEKEISKVNLIEINTDLLKEAKETLDIANDIVVTLQNKIDDYIEQIQKLSNMINDAIITTDENGNILSSNIYAGKIFGYSHEELICMNFNEIIYKDTINDIYLNKISDKCEKEIYYYKKGQAIKKDGSVFFFEMSISKLTRTDNTIYYIMIIKDISKEIELTKDLKKDKKYFKNLYEQFIKKG